MKKNIIFTGAFVAMMCVFGMSTANAQSDVEDVKEYCTLDQFKDGKTLHGRGIDKSRDQQQARSKARSAALQELAENLEMNIKSFVRDYRHSVEINDDEEIIKLSGSLSQRVVDQNMKNISTVCEKGITYTNDKGVTIYKYYQIVECDKAKVQKAVYEGLKKEGVLKAEYSYQQFLKESHFDDVIVEG
jgi:hypothetical protein